MSTQSIPVSAIDPPLFNSRLDENVGTPDELKAFGATLKKDQQSEIRVTVSGPNRWRLIFGSRRLAAAKAVGMETINAKVVEPGSEAAEILANGVENTQRKDLTTFEQARLCSKLRELKMSGKEVASELGISPQHVSNLAICFDKLPPEIKKAWKDGGPATDMNFLRSIVTKEDHGKVVQATPEEMLAAYNERVESLKGVTGEEEDEEEEDEEEDDTPTAETAGAPAPQSFKVQKARYKAVLKALRASRAPQLAVDACRYLVGDIEKVRGLKLGDETRPEKKTKKDDK